MWAIPCYIARTGTPTHPVKGKASMSRDHESEAGESSDSSASPRVWIVNVAGHDYSAAREYGELRRLTEGYVSRGSLDRMLWTVVRGLKDSAAHDWLLPAGMLALNAIAVTAWYELHGSVRLLVYNSKTGDYDPLEITPRRISDLIELPPKADDAGPGNAQAHSRGTS